MFRKWLSNKTRAHMFSAPKGKWACKVCSDDERADDNSWLRKRNERSR